MIIQLSAISITGNGISSLGVRVLKVPQERGRPARNASSSLAALLRVERFLTKRLFGDISGIWLFIGTKNTRFKNGGCSTAA